MDRDDAAIFERQREGCLISTDPAKLDLDVIHGFLSQAYWSEDVPRSTLERAIRNSLCFGVYVDGGQAGFARVVTGRSRPLSRCISPDVFILEPHPPRPRPSRNR